MLRRVPQHPYAAIIFSGFLIFACKLAGCVAARVVYGPDYIAQGYVAADWRTAKLMITLLWSFSTSLSLGLLLADYRCCTQKNHRDAGLTMLRANPAGASRLQSTRLVRRVGDPGR
jgi:hypothetical protein